MKSIILSMVLTLTVLASFEATAMFGCGGAQKRDVVYSGQEARSELYPPESVKKGDQYPCGSNEDGSTEMCTR